MSEIKKVHFGHAPPGVESEYAERTFHAEDGWKFELVGRKGIRLIKGETVVDVHNVPFQIVLAGKRRDLTEDDFRRMNLPPQFWKPSLKRVPDSVAAPVTNYINDLDTMLRAGAGLVLGGGAGVGKTGIASLVAVEVRLRGRTVFFTTISDLRELIRSRVAFDKDTSVLERCREVDFLVLDSLRPEDAKEHPFDASSLEGLLESRVQWKRPTIITTRMKFEEYARTFKNVMEILKGRSVFLDVVGENQRESQEQRLLKRLGLSTPEVPAAETEEPPSPALGPEKEVRLTPAGLPAPTNKKKK